MYATQDAHTSYAPQDTHTSYASQDIHTSYAPQDIHTSYAACRPIVLAAYYLINSSGSGWIKLVSRVSFHMPVKFPALSDILSLIHI